MHSPTPVQPESLAAIAEVAGVASASPTWAARASNRPQSIDAYIACAPQAVRPVLASIRATVQKAAPAAEERISYRMPAFFFEGALVYFAAFKKHIGFYPPVRDEKLRSALARYAGPKGNLQFPLSEPMPHALIARLVKARIQENLARKSIPTQETSMSTAQKVKGPASYFPSIEKTYGQPIDHWLRLVAERKDLKHMEVVAWLKAQHGLGHGHANAIVAHVFAAKAK
jgi:uncharacterized protein YdhG (YjbR/CyaY superfamily)